ncbi:MAG TPA: septation protein IspZ [Asticcacaulis sp.]|nr:septation protein IspZ [Asticcacaulis sp.]
MDDKKDVLGEANPDIVAKPGDKQNNLKMAVDYGPVLLFGATFFVAKFIGKLDSNTALIWGSGVLAAASVVAVIVGFLLEKRIAWIPLVAAILGIPFAVLTVVFKNPVFVKIKMTIIDALIGGVLLGALAMKKQPLKALLGEALPLKEQAWTPLTLYYGLFYWATAALNEIIWRTQSDSVWVTWKMLSIVGGPVVLAICLLPFFMKNLVLPAEADDSKKTK